MTRSFICTPGTPMTITVHNVVDFIRPRFQKSAYQFLIDQRGQPTHNPLGHPALVMGVWCEPVPVKAVVPPPVRSIFYEAPRGRGRAHRRRRDEIGKGGFTPVVGSLALPRPVKAEPVTEENPLINFFDTAIPDLGKEDTCLQPVKVEDPEREDIFRRMSGVMSLEGDTREQKDSAVVSPLQSSSPASSGTEPCPERPEEQFFTVGAPEGSSQPGAGLLSAPGIPSPAFPRVGDLMVRRSPELVPLMMQLFVRMDHLYTQINCHQRMLDYSRHDLHCVGHVLEDLVKACDIDPEDPGLRHPCGGTH